MINKFKLGSNLDIEALPAINELNEKYKDKSTILEFYGSTRKYAVTAARPDFRLPDVSDEDLAKYVKKALDYGIGFNWTMNSIAPYNTKQEMLAHKNDIIECGKWLEDIGVSRITVTHPMLGMILREGGIKLPFELSTISHLDAVTQIKFYKQYLGVDKICLSLIRNRDFAFLKNAQKICDNEGIMLDLMVNEFCATADKESATHCIFRDSCYVCHANCVTKEDSTAYHNYPMAYCSSSRGMNEAGWMRGRFVLPQWIPIYNKEAGVHHWKITGRTGETSTLLKLAEAFLSQQYDKGLIQLWKPLETIWNSGLSEAEAQSKYPFIDCNIITEKGFLDHWTKDNFRCHEHMCGGDPSLDPTYDKEKGFGELCCNYCPTFFNKHLKK